MKGKTKLNQLLQTNKLLYKLFSLDKKVKICNKISVGKFLIEVLFDEHDNEKDKEEEDVGEGGGGGGIGKWII